MLGKYISLRPFGDADISLMEKWLHQSHVAKWYEHPDNWLSELYKRHVITAHKIKSKIRIIQETNMYD